MPSGPGALFGPRLNTTSLISFAIGIYESIARSSLEKIGEMRSSRLLGIEGLEKENKLIKNSSKHLPIFSLPNTHMPY